MTPIDLGARHLISLGRLGPVAAQLERVFAEHGVERQVAVQTGDSSFAAELVAAGCGVALTDAYFLLSNKPDDLLAVPFRPTIMYRPFVFHLQQHVLSHAEKRLMANLSKSAANWSLPFRALHCEPA